MADKQLTNNGYRPTSEKVDRGYQPILETPHKPSPNGGYQPVSTGDNPANAPTPPKER
jgi:hypothetical protein